MILLELFWSFCKIGFTSFGGLSMVPLINSEMLSHGWMTLSEVSDIVAIAEMTPGPIAINASTYVGTKMAGLPGAVSATLGMVMPSFLIIAIISGFYLQFKSNPTVGAALLGIRAGVTALVVSAALKLGKKAEDVPPLGLHDLIL